MASAVTQSNLFRCYRTLGLFAGDRAASCCAVGNALHLLVPTNNSFISYNITHKLDFLYRSVDFEEKVEAVHSYGYKAIVVTAHMVVFERSSGIFEKLGIDGTISSSLLFGEHIIVTTESRMHVIAIKDGTIFKTINIPCASPKLFHPREYMNKVLLISGNQCFLMNINTEKTLFTFTFPAPVTAIAQSPDVDVHAVALETGEVILFDLRQNKKIGSFFVANKPSSVCFVNGLPGGDLFLIVGDVVGRITVISIKSGIVIGTLFHHVARVHTLISIPNELHFFSVGDDNAIRMYVIDTKSGSLVPVLVRQRCGHPRKPHYLKFSNYQLATASPDGSVRLSSIFNPMLTQELSQKVSKKARRNGVSVEEYKRGRVNCLDVNLRYALVHDSMVTTHDGDHRAFTWNTTKYTINQNALMGTVVSKNKGQGKHSGAMRREVQDNEKSIDTCCCFSHCGNFVLIGNSLGTIDRFSVQSGEHKLFYLKHTAQITGLACDSNNKYVVSAANDGKVLLWDFETARVLATLLSVSVPITHFVFNNENDICTVVDAENTVSIIDVSSRRVIRTAQLPGIVSAVTFNRQGKYVIVAYTSGVTEVYDIVTMKVIDAIQTKSPIVSMDVSVDGQFLAFLTVKEPEVQVFLFRDYFSTVLLDTPKEPFVIRFANNTIFECDAIMNYAYDDSAVPMEVEVKQPRETARLLEATDTPIARWVNLPDLDRIRREMKIETSRTQALDIPFFMPMQQGIDAVFKPMKMDSKLVKDQPTLVKTTLLSMLSASSDEDILAYLMGLNSSHIELEVRTLDSDEYAQLDKFLLFMRRELETYRNYDYLITVLQVTLRVCRPLSGRILTHRFM